MERVLPPSDDMTNQQRSSAPAAGELLASDLDGTLLPPAWSPERARELQAFRATIAASPGLRLAYVTGRHLEHALEAMDAFELPLPDYLACEVGTALYAARGGSYHEVPDFQARMAAALGATGEDVRRALASLDGITLQDAGHQGAFKASFFLPWPPPEGLMEEARVRLEAVGARTTVVTSRGPGGEGLLDVLPGGGAKDRAVRYVADLLDIDEKRVLFAGDSGNDRAALLAGSPGVVVGNASGSFVEELRAEARRLGTLDRIHFASLPYAGGVMEGMRHFGIGAADM